MTIICVGYSFGEDKLSRLAKYEQCLAFFCGKNMAKIKNQVEYDWLKKQPGVASKYIDEMWTQYFETQGVYDKDDCEQEWLRQLIITAGGTPTATKYASDLWKQLLTKLGLRVSKSYEENRDTYFRNT